MSGKFTLTVSLLASTLLACGNSGNPRLAETTLHRGLGGEPSTLDPVSAADNYSFEVLRDLYEGLTSETPNGEIIPGSASSWTVDETGKQYIFHIRPDAQWSNGTRLVADDFVRSWRRIVDPKEASPVADDLRLIAGAAAIIDGHASPSSLGVFALKDDVLQVNLEQAAPFLPQLLTHSAAFPTYSSSTSNGRTRDHMISNGSYVLSSWSPGTTIELSKNKYYWDKNNVRIDKVQYQIADENSQFARYRAGQLDLTDTVPPNVLAAIQKDYPAELHIAPFLATAYYGINLSEQSLRDNLRLRKAMSMAIDRKRLVESLGFGQTSAFGFVPPGVLNYTPQAWEWSKLDDSDRIRIAKKLYADAGFNAGNPPEIRLLYNSNPIIRNTAVIIAEMWKNVLGIKTILNEEEYRVFLQSRHDKSRWEIARLGWTADYNDASNFLSLFREHSNNNDSSYSSIVYDRLLNEAASSADIKRRREYLESAERTMLSDYPVIPLYFYVSKRLLKPNITGLQSNPLNRVPSKSLSFSN